MVDPSEPFHDSRPSGILSKSSFNVAKFVGITVALAAGAAAGVGGYIMLKDRDATEPAEAITPPPPPAKIDVGTAPSPKLDVGNESEDAQEADVSDGAIRLDLPFHPSNSPGGQPEQGPDFEVPEWD